MPSIHRPVLMREVLSQLQLEESLVVADGTVGGGGHSFEILKRIGTNGRLIGFDRDEQMIAHANSKLSSEYNNFELAHSSYAKMREILDGLEIESVDRILLDLGLSSDQLADHDRGFSFHSNGPLDLRFDTTNGIPTWQWLERVSEDEISKYLLELSDENHHQAIAKEIKRQERKSPVRTAENLTQLVERVIPNKRSSKDSHPATRTFQALRIACNEELEQVRLFLENQIEACLKPGGRLAIITFHSIEDRMIKLFFKQNKNWTDVTKKPILPTPAEIRINPRSRSAKLRAGTLK